MVSQVEEIKNRLDVAEVIQGYLKLQKAGAYWKGLCPFHNEKTPSFVVTPGRQMWHCFGCGEGGDIFSFISKMEGLEFPDVLRLLAERAGVKLAKQDPQLNSQRKRMYEICELSAKFFERQLMSQTGRQAAGYLKDRGLTPESVKDFRIGWAPDTWQSLTNFLNAEGYDDKEIESAGLTVKSGVTENLIRVDPRLDQRQSAPERYHDRFRHRIIFPIANSQGQVVGFTGRIFEKIKSQTVHADAGKYVNTPGTILYDKSQLLYGLDKARTYFKDIGCILVEGTLDVIMSHQAGVKNAVATCGTALTVAHTRIIKRYTEKLNLAFDADEAGDNALKKGVVLAMSAGLNVSVISIPLGKDTADAVKEDPDSWLKVAANPVPYLEHIMNRSLRSFTGTLEAKRIVLSNVLPFIKSIVSPLEKDYWLEELSRRAEVGKEILAAEIKHLPVQDSGSSQPAGVLASKPEGRHNLAGLRQEEYLLSLLIRYPDLKSRLGDEEMELFSRPELFSLAKRLAADSGKTIPDTTPSSIVLMSEMLVDFNIDPEAEFVQTLKGLKKQYLQSKLKLIQTDIKKAETASDAAALELLLKEFSESSKKLSEL
ncbi:MAG: DNA primase [Candidatus Sungbacteria bacterium]|uniref:DNA primase n=1 Tax=Candidatus Sungiibacteriota bacterium TaxID=2750080 RepID=A0A9D6DP86_9BACT|nr:DNA primase [Candidatus Sungbacteria bacterium]